MVGRKEIRSACAARVVHTANRDVTRRPITLLLSSSSRAVFVRIARLRTDLFQTPNEHVSREKPTVFFHYSACYRFAIEQRPRKTKALLRLSNNAKMRLEEDLVIRRSRPTMISAKYRAREERRRLLKISAGKLRRIEDPEASLCRSVLINNAVRRLQRENRDEKTRNYGLPVVTYLSDSTKENNISSNLIAGVTDDDASSRKRLSDDTRNDGLGPKRQRHDDLDLQDDVFSDFYILPPTPRLLSHIDEVLQEPDSPHHHHLVYPEDRLGSVDVRSVGSITSTANTTTNTSSTASGNGCCNSVMFPSELDDGSSQLTGVTRSSDIGMMETTDVVDPDRICDFARFADSAKSLEERLVELQSLDEHFDLTKFERNNNQSCGRAFHDIQTFHSLVPGLET